MELNFSLKWNLVNQGGRVPPGVPGQTVGEFRDLAPSPIDRWESKLALSGSDSASPPVAYSPNSRNSSLAVPAHLGERWLLKTIPAICTSEYCNAQR